MVSRLSIGARLGVLIGLQLLLLVVVGTVGLSGLDRAGSTTTELSGQVGRALQTQNLLRVLDQDLIGNINRLNAGVLTWQDGQALIDAATLRFNQAWSDYLAQLPAGRANEVRETLGPGQAEVGRMASEVQRLVDAEDRNTLDLFVINDLEPLVAPFRQGMENNAQVERDASVDALADSAATNAQFLTLVGIILVVGLVSAVGLGLVIFRSITRPVARIAQTVGQVSEGDYAARTELEPGDEIGKLGQAFDNLLEERVATLSQAQKENEILNDSVIGLLRAVSRLSAKDLTVRAPVTEDVTGPVADAINQMADETGRVLNQVRSVAEQVNQASARVSEQALTVNQVADRQTVDVEQAANELAEASGRMNAIAEVAERCNGIAAKTTQTTQTAAETVQGTLNTIQDIRSVIQDTGRRIKRLGERSQEISGIVDIINGIAERTTVLALNASMQAAAAGEAGRGFAVVADEVQRLAENSRNATAQIATLVKNIQVETSDTINTMDQAITKVVAGTELAEQAGSHMRETTMTTAELVQAVGQIADNSSQQARLTQALRDRARGIQDQTRETGERLDEQQQYTTQLADFARQLLESVQVFKLSA